MNVRSLLRDLPGGFLTPIFIMLPVVALVSRILPQKPNFAGQSLSIVISLFSVALALALWSAMPVRHSWPLSAWFFIISLTLLWLLVMLSRTIGGQGVAYSAIAFGTWTLMMMAKNPDSDDFRFAGLAMSWTLVAVLIFFEIAAYTDLLSSQAYGMGLSSTLLAPGRFGGPWDNPNLVGPIGASLSIFALVARSWSRPTLFAAGALVVLASNSKAALFGLSAGLGVFAAAILLERWSSWRSSTRLVIGTIALLTSSGVITYAAMQMRADPSLDGRTRIWGAYFDLWLTKPLNGIGSVPAESFIAAGTLPPSGVHAHNLWLDLVTRFGWVGLLLGSSLLISAFILAFRQFRHGQPIGLAMLGIFTVTTTLEVHFDWVYLSLPVVYLMASIFMNVRDAQHTKPTVETEREDHIPS